MFFYTFFRHFTDQTRELVTIFNWLDFGIFFMQNIDSVYIVKDSARTNLHYRTLWSMPVPTASHLSAYQQFMTQPAYQLSESTCFPFINNPDPRAPSDIFSSLKQNAQQFSNAQDANTKQPEPPLPKSSTAAKINPMAAAIEKCSIAKSQSDDITVKNSVQNSVKPATELASNTVSNATLIASENAIPSATTNQTLETDMKKTDTIMADTSITVVNEELNATVNQTVLNDPVVNEKIQRLKTLMENDKFEKLEDETLKMNSSIVPKKKSRTRNKKSEMGSIIVEPTIFIDGHWENETFAVGDIVEVVSGDWIGLRGRVTAIRGKKVFVTGNIDGVEFDDSLIFKEKQLFKLKSNGRTLKAYIKENDTVIPNINAFIANEEINTDANQDTLDVPSVEDENLICLMNAIENYVKSPEESNELEYANDNEDFIIQKETVKSQDAEGDEAQVGSDNFELLDSNLSGNKNQNEGEIEGNIGKIQLYDANESSNESNKKENFTVDTDESAIQKDLPLMDDVTHIVDQNLDETSSIDQEESWSDAIQSDEHEYKNEDEHKTENAIDESITLNEECFDDNLTEKPIDANLETINISNFDKNESNETKNHLEDTTIDDGENKVTQFCESMKVINIEDTENSIEQAIGENDVISIQAGQGS